MQPLALLEFSHWILTLAFRKGLTCAVHCSATPALHSGGGWRRFARKAAAALILFRWRERAAALWALHDDFAVTMLYVRGMLPKL